MTPARLAALVACIAGCAHDVRARLPAQPGEPTGSITIVLTQSARNLTVSINGVLVADRAHSERVHIQGVPAGAADVVVAAGGGETRIERHMSVAVAAGRDTAIPLAGPDKPMSQGLAMGLLSATVWVLSRAAILAFL